MKMIGITSILATLYLVPITSGDCFQPPRPAVPVIPAVTYNFAQLLLSGTSRLPVCSLDPAIYRLKKPLLQPATGTWYHVPVAYVVLSVPGTRYEEGPEISELRALFTKNST